MTNEEELLTYFKGAINYPKELRKNLLSLDLWKRANLLVFLKSRDMELYKKVERLVYKDGR